MRQREPDNLSAAEDVEGEVVEPEVLQRITDVAENAAASIKAGRMAITETQEADIAWVITCGGSLCCPLGKQDSLDLGLKLEDKYHKMQLPAKLCIGVCGCSNQCAEACIKDIGIVGMEDGWKVFVGGSGGDESKPAKELADGVSTRDVLELVDEVIEYYAANAAGGQRLWALIEKMGFKRFKTAVSGE